MDKSKSLLSQVLNILNEREAEIIRMRFGIDRNRTYTLKEIANHFGRSRERIRQIEKDALEKIAMSNIGEELKKFI